MPVRVDLRAEGGTLRVTVTDEGAGDTGGTTPGFGLVGMRERARSVGGTVEAGVRGEGGFEVVAVLPLGGAVAALPAQNSVREAEAVHESAAVRESDVVREAEPVRAVEAVREAEFDRGELR